ncbi:MAG: mechanosensitive ion channel family protein [Gammaproteobacteria bacterium]
MNAQDFLQLDLFGITIESLALSMLAIFATWILMALAWKYLLKRLEILAKRTDTIIDDAFVFALGKTNTLWMVIIGLYIGSRFLELPEPATRVIHILTVIAVLIQGGIWVNAAISCLIDRSRSRRIAEDPASATMLSVIGFIGKLLLWSIVLLLILDNFGFDITALVAGLGVGGVAVALAVQNILGDLFASLSIVLDKPFTIGDFIVVDDMMGSVEYVGLKTTRVRSLSGEQLVFANSDLLSSRVRNYGRMYKRRVVFHIGVTYQTQRDKLKIIPQILREAIESQESITFDRSNFQKYGDFALIFETVYFVMSPDYNLYMDINEAVNLQIHHRFEEEGIEFAYPTQTVFVAGGQKQVAD